MRWASTIFQTVGYKWLKCNDLTISRFVTYYRVQVGQKMILGGGLPWRLQDVFFSSQKADQKTIGRGGGPHRWRHRHAGIGIFSLCFWRGFFPGRRSQRGWSWNDGETSDFKKSVVVFSSILVSSIYGRAWACIWGARDVCHCVLLRKTGAMSKSCLRSALWRQNLRLSVRWLLLRAHRGRKKHTTGCGGSMTDL